MSQSSIVFKNKILKILSPVISEDVSPNLLWNLLETSRHYHVYRCSLDQIDPHNKIVETERMKFETNDFLVNPTKLGTGNWFSLCFVLLASLSQFTCISLIVRQRKAEVIIPNVWNIRTYLWLDFKYLKSWVFRANVLVYQPLPYPGIPMWSSRTATNL